MFRGDTAALSGLLNEAKKSELPQVSADQCDWHLVTDSFIWQLYQYWIYSLLLRYSHFTLCTGLILAHFDYLNSLLLNCEVCNFNLLTFLLCVASQQVTFSLTHCWHIALLTHSLTSLCACLCVRRTVGRPVCWTFSWSIFSKRAGSHFHWPIGALARIRKHRNSSQSVKL